MELCFWISVETLDFPKKVSLKILKSADNNSFSDLVSAFLKGVWLFNFLIFWRHTASIKFWISKVRDFGNFEISPMIYVIRNKISLAGPFDLFLIYRKAYKWAAPRWIYRTLWRRNYNMMKFVNLYPLLLSGNNTGLDKQNFWAENCKYFSYPSVLTYVLGAQKNRLIETVLLSTHNICFGWEIRKLFFFDMHS